MEPSQNQDNNQTPTNNSLPPVEGASSQQNGDASQQNIDVSNFNVDYLDKIAVNNQKPINKFAVFGLIGAVLLAAFIGLAAIATPKKGNSANDLMLAIQRRIDTLDTVADAQQKKLKESHLNEANSILAANLGTMRTDISPLVVQPPVTKKSKKAPTPKETLVEDAYRDALVSQFDQAYQRGTLDTNYAGQMIFELNTLNTQLSRASSVSKSAAIKEFAATSIDNITKIIEMIEKFDSSKQ